MRRTPTLLIALALLVYGSCAFAQAAAQPSGQAAKDAPAPTDEDLTKAVHSALDADPHHFFRHVTVSVDKGVVTLGGFVDTSQAINRARTIAGKVPGVTRVVTNNLSLEPNRPR
jgi:osmotically-inducible protein OsmY